MFNAVSKCLLMLFSHFSCGDNYKIVVARFNVHRTVIATNDFLCALHQIYEHILKTRKSSLKHAIVFRTVWDLVLSWPAYRAQFMATHDIPNRNVHLFGQGFSMDNWKFSPWLSPEYIGLQWHSQRATQRDSVNWINLQRKLFVKAEWIFASSTSRNPMDFATKINCCDYLMWKCWTIF